jgi:zinc/manganese transport system substrate-binding protein
MQIVELLVKRIAVLFVVVFLLCAGRAAEAKLHVVTTVQTFKSLADEVGGDKIEATALVGEAVDPHFVDARPSYAVLLSRADLLVHVGLELEKGWLPPLLSQARNPGIQTGQPGNLDASTAGINVADIGVGTSRTQGDIHPLGNPHYWLTPDSARAVATAIEGRLAQLDAADAGYFSGRLAAFGKKLDEAKKRWEATAAPLRGVKVVTYHKSWGYITAWLGMVEIGYVEPKPGIPPDPAHLADLVRTASAQGAKLVLVESFYPRNTAERVASKGGMKLLVLPPDGPHYFELMDSLVNQLAAAVK